MAVCSAGALWTFAPLGPIAHCSSNHGSRQYKPEAAQSNRDGGDNAENATGKTPDPKTVPCIPGRSSRRVCLVVLAAAHPLTVTDPVTGSIETLVPMSVDTCRSTYGCLCRRTDRTGYVRLSLEATVMTEWIKATTRTHKPVTAPARGTSSESGFPGRGCAIW